jgi:antirestriction protein ArdC
MKSSATPTSKTDLYERVTTRILDDLSTGTRPWVKPWTATRVAGPVTRPLRHTGEAYRGLSLIHI